MRWMNAAVSAAASSIRAEATRRYRTASWQTVGGVIQSVTALSRFTAGSHCAMRHEGRPSPC